MVRSSRKFPSLLIIILLSVTWTLSKWRWFLKRKKKLYLFFLVIWFINYSDLLDLPICLISWFSKINCLFWCRALALSLVVLYLTLHFKHMLILQIMKCFIPWSISYRCNWISQWMPWSITQARRITDVRWKAVSAVYPLILWEQLLQNYLQVLQR